MHAACPPHLQVLFSPFDVVQGEDTSIQPDLLVAQRSAIGSVSLRGAPLLAVEVLSPSTRSIDLVLKRDRLERSGCPSYWVLDPVARRLLAWELGDGRYVEVADVSGAKRWKAERPYPVEVCPDDITRP